MPRALLAVALIGATLASAATPATALEFHTIKTTADLQRELAAVVKAKRTAMIWVRADWALSALDMEKRIFTAPEVVLASKQLTLLRADITHFDSQDKQLLATLQLRGAPAVVFYGADGTERRNFRVLRTMEAAAFAAMISAASSSAPDKTP